MKADLQALLTEHGEDLLFLVPLLPLHSFMGLIHYTSNSDDTVLAPAKISQRRYQIKNNYKVELVPIYSHLETRSFYITDLESLINQGQVQVFIPAVKQVELA